MIAPLLLKGVGSLVLVSAVIAGGYIFYNSAYNTGYEERVEEQKKADTAAYDRIKERIENEDLDIDNPAAVDCLLRELAGTLAEGEECSDLRRDGANED